MKPLAEHAHRTGRHRSRLWLALIAGALAWCLLPGEPLRPARALLAWNLAVWPYLVSMAWTMWRASAEHVRRVAGQEDASSPMLVLLIVAAALTSLVGIVAELARAPDAGAGAWLAVGLPLATVVGSWFFVGVVYTFHYAHLFYRAAPDKRPLRFPDEVEQPGYRDFLYFSFTIAAAAQTSDVTVSSTAMRVAVLGQTVLSFFFNAAILGLFINIAAGLAGRH